MDHTMQQALEVAAVAVGGLRLPVHKGAGESVKQAVHDHWDTLDGIEEELSGLGLGQTQEPPFGYPGAITPDALTTQNSRNYSTLYAEHLSWYNYTAEVVARIRAYLVQVENERTDILSRLRKQMRGQNSLHKKEDKLSAADMLDVIEQDPRYRELTRLQQMYQQKKLLTEAHLDGMDRNLRLFSRQVEIRRAEFDNTNTGSNMANRGGRGGLPSGL